MPIFSYKNNFVLFHIPKCGGTSLSTIVKDVTDTEPFIKHSHYTYLQAKQIFSKNGKADWFKQANKIAVVRNPFNRMISLYAYIKNHRNHYLHRRIKDWSFNDFCIFVNHLLEVDKKQDKILPCFDYLKDEKGDLCDDIQLFKLEDLKQNEIIQTIALKTGVNIDKIPQVNCSFYPEEDFKKSEDVIKNTFEQDYKQFGY